MNVLTAPSDIIAGAAPKWQARDDVYQVGQLLGMLVRGNARTRIRTFDVRAFDCSDHLKEIIYRCIGERRKRYENADELDRGAAPPAEGSQDGPPAIAQRRAPRLYRHPHHPAERGDRRRQARRRDRARVAVGADHRHHPRPSNPLQAAGREGGVKLMEIKRLREKGHRITLLNESQFWKLAGPKSRKKEHRIPATRRFQCAFPRAPASSPPPSSSSRCRWSRRHPRRDRGETARDLAAAPPQSVGIDADRVKRIGALAKSFVDDGRLSGS